ncbi:uncharacterized protein LOC142165880 [Nicotiana tabacum]|uniref:Uncharacterized protein LOC142165880 n=1 Tax=Nicotiana tabacum TaxID=4097 RepID=A0AC58S5V6_TOBAC
MRGELENDFKLNVTRSKLKRAKVMILEKLDGSFKDEYNKLEAYGQELRLSNPGSDVAINISKDALKEGKKRFLRLYIYFQALKLGFKSGLRPLIGLDGTFLKGKFKGQLLVAMVQDSMNQFYPLAWAVVDKETSRTWSWFVDLLKRSLDLNNGAGVTFISDMQKPSQGLLDAVSTVLLDAHHRHMPIIKMLENIMIKVMERLADYEGKAMSWTDNFSPLYMKLYHDYREISHVCTLNFNGDNGYEIIEGKDKHTVNLEKKRCTCRLWNLSGIPCPHAIKALMHEKIEPVTQIHWWYSKEAYLLTYKYKIQPVRGVQF